MLRVIQHPINIKNFEEFVLGFKSFGLGDFSGFIPLVNLKGDCLVILAWINTKCESYNMMPKFIQITQENNRPTMI